MDNHAEKPTTAAPAQSSEASATTIEIVEEEPEHNPIAGARVRVSSWLGNLEKTSDPSGRVSLDLKGQYTIRISAKGYVGVQTTRVVVSGLVRIALARTGSVSFVFSDDFAKPVRGVGIALDPANARITLLSSGVPALNKESGADGRIDWPELPPHGRYAWKCRSAHVLLPDDTVEKGGPRAITDSQGRVTIQDDGSSPFDYGGVFSIESGKTTLVRVLVKQAASIRGKLLGTFSKPGSAVVRILHREIIKGESGSFSSYQQEKAGIADKDGSFEFDGLRPGAKVVKAAWRDDRLVYRFVTHSCTLVSGEKYDAGILLPREGISITVALNLEPEEYSAIIPKGKVRAEVKIHNSPPGKSTETTDRILSETFELQVGEAVSLAGLEAGYLQITCSPRIPDDITGPPVEIQSPSPFEAWLPGPERVQLTMKAVAKTKVTITCPIPEASGEQYIQAILVPQGKGSILRMGGDSVRPGLKEVRIEGFAESGEYDVWVVSKTGVAATYGRGRLVVANGTASIGGISSEQGATVRGKALTRDGQPFPYDVHLSMDSNTAGQVASIYQAVLNARGEFELRGVVPGIRLKSPLFTETIEVGPAGSEITVELRERP